MEGWFGPGKWQDTDYGNTTLELKFEGSPGHGSNVKSVRVLMRQEWFFYVVFRKYHERTRERFYCAFSDYFRDAARIMRFLFAVRNGK